MARKHISLKIAIQLVTVRGLFFFKNISTKNLINYQLQTIFFRKPLRVKKISVKKFKKNLYLSVNFFISKNLNSTAILVFYISQLFKKV